MACASCGSPNLLVARFCARCGQPLAGSLSPETDSGGSPGHNAAHIAQEPDVSSLEYRPPPSLFKGPEAGLWQRAVMGLAALALVLMGLAVLVGGVDSATP